MTPSDLKAWRAALALSQAGAAAALGVPVRSYEQWETGRRRCPALLDMACLAVDHAARIQADGQALAG